LSSDSFQYLLRKYRIWKYELYTLILSGFSRFGSTSTDYFHFDDAFLQYLDRLGFGLLLTSQQVSIFPRRHSPLGDSLQRDIYRCYSMQTFGDLGVKINPKEIQGRETNPRESNNRSLFNDIPLHPQRFIV